MAVISDCLAQEVSSVHAPLHLVDQLYADSLDLLDMLRMLNEEFNIKLGSQDFMKMETVGDVCSIVSARVAEINPTP